MKDLELDDEMYVAGGIRKEEPCPENCHVCITASQGEPPQCDC